MRNRTSVMKPMCWDGIWCGYSVCSQISLFHLWQVVFSSPCGVDECLSTVEHLLSFSEFYSESVEGFQDWSWLRYPTVVCRMSRSVWLHWCTIAACFPGITGNVYVKATQISCSPRCFLLVDICSFQVSFLSRCNPRYFAVLDLGISVLFRVTAGHSCFRKVKVTWTDLELIPF